MSHREFPDPAGLDFQLIKDVTGLITDDNIDRISTWLSGYECADTGSPERDEYERFLRMLILTERTKSACDRAESARERSRELHIQSREINERIAKFLTRRSH